MNHLVEEMQHLAEDHESSCRRRRIIWSLKMDHLVEEDESPGLKFFSHKKSVCLLQNCERLICGFQVFHSSFVKQKQQA